MTQMETFLQDTIFPQLEAGRPNWDKPHTEAVVAHIKQLIEANPQLSLDREVLIIAAYAHDWGYVGLFRNGQKFSLDDVTSAKEAHMTIGAEKLRELLKDPRFDALSVERKARAVHLVFVHDKLKELKEVDELILMEADTLGGLDVERVEPSFDIESNERYMSDVRSKRLPLFITEYGKREFERLYGLREEYYTG